MKKAKTTVIISAAVVLAAVIACLPYFISARYDSVHSSAAYSDISSVEFDLSGEMSTFDKLVYYPWMDDSPADDDVTDDLLDDDEAIAAAADFVYALYDAGAIPPEYDLSFTEKTNTSAYFYVKANPENLNQYFYYWTVTFFDTANYDEHTHVTIDIDAETGDILYIEYPAYGEYTMDGVWERNRARIDALTSLYFERLGLSEVEESVRNTAGSYEYSETDGGVSAARYYLSGDSGEKTVIEFSVDGAGGLYMFFGTAQ